MFWWGVLVGIGQGLVIWLQRHVRKTEQEKHACEPVQHPADSGTRN